MRGGYGRGAGRRRHPHLVVLVEELERYERRVTDPPVRAVDQQLYALGGDDLRTGEVRAGVGQPRRGKATLRVLCITHESTVGAGRAGALGRIGADQAHPGELRERRAILQRMTTRDDSPDTLGAFPLPAYTGTGSEEDPYVIDLSGAQPRPGQCGCQHPGPADRLPAVDGDGPGA